MCVYICISLYLYTCRFFNSLVHISNAEIDLSWWIGLDLFNDAEINGYHIHILVSFTAYIFIFPLFIECCGPPLLQECYYAFYHCCCDQRLPWIQTQLLIMRFMSRFAGGETLRHPWHSIDENYLCNGWHCCQLHNFECACKSNYNACHSKWSCSFFGKNKITINVLSCTSGVLHIKRWVRQDEWIAWETHFNQIW